MGLRVSRRHPPTRPGTNAICRSKTIFLFLLGHRLQVARIMASEVLVPIGLLGLSKATLDHAGTEIRQVLSLYTRPQAMPALVHCTQGKDRTGALEFPPSRDSRLYHPLRILG